MQHLLLGIFNIAINIAILVFIGLIVVWILGWLSMAVPENVKKAFMIIVALIALYQVAALIFGLPFTGLVPL